MTYSELSQAFQREHNQLDTLYEVLVNEFDCHPDVAKKVYELDHYTEYEPSSIGHGEYDADADEWELVGPDADAVLDKVYDYIQTAVLCVDVFTTKQVLLGCGGPTRYIEIKFNQDGEAVSGKYVNTEYSQQGYTLNDDEIADVVDRYALDSCM